MSIFDKNKDFDNDDNNNDSNDNSNNDENKDFNDESNLQNDDMKYITNIKSLNIKVKSFKEAYKIFVKLFAHEEKFFYEKEYLWILGIDEYSYAVCAEVVALELDKIQDLNTSEIFRSAVKAESTKIILAHNQIGNGKPRLDQRDLNYTNVLYHKARMLNIEVIDHIVLNRESLTTQNIVHYSYKSNGIMQIIKQDITYQTVEEADDELEREREDCHLEGAENKALEIAAKMLKKGIDLKTISECTMLSQKKIKEIDENALD